MLTLNIFPKKLISTVFQFICHQTAYYLLSTLQSPVHIPLQKSGSLLFVSGKKLSYAFSPSFFNYKLNKSLICDRKPCAAVLKKAFTPEHSSKSVTIRVNIEAEPTSQASTQIAGAIQAGPSSNIQHDQGRIMSSRLSTSQKALGLPIGADLELGVMGSQKSAAPLLCGTGPVMGKQVLHSSVSGQKSRTNSRAGGSRFASMGKSFSSTFSRFNFPCRSVS